MSDTSAGADLERLADGIAVLRFNRPQNLNALTDDTVGEIGRLLDVVKADRTIRVLILTGEGRSFCAGFDLGLADDAPDSAELGEPTAWMLRQEAFAGLIFKLRGLRQPVIAAVNGTANGAGLCLALAAEIRIAATTAKFNAAFVRIGLSGCDMGSGWLLPRVVGLSCAFEILLTGRMVEAVEAYRIGLVSEMVEPEALLQRAFEIARAISANDPFGVWMTKRGVWANVETGSLQAAMELDNRTQILARTTGSLSKAARAFRERRKLRPAPTAQ